MTEFLQLDRSGETHALSLKQVLPSVRNGKVINIKRGLQSAGVFDSILEITLETVEEVAGKTAAEAVKTLGIKRIHNHVTPVQLESIIRNLNRRLGKINVGLTKAIGKKLLGVKKPFYVQHAFLARLFIPYDSFVENRDLYGKDEHRGRLSMQSPHHDYWFRVPMNTINFWIAVGPVTPENGIIFYPDTWGYNIPRAGEHVHKSQLLGEPLRIHCDPGDILVFDSKLMHSSVLNRGSETRYVLTSRMVLDKPVPFTAEELDKVYYYSPLVGTRFEKTSRYVNRLSLFYLREKTKYKLRLFLNRFETKQKNGLRNRILGSFYKRLRYRRGELDHRLPSELSRVEQTSPSSAAEIPEKEIVAVNRKVCLARVNGKVHAFDRWCRHQGADLAAGHIHDGQIVCPWHDYCIDPETGKGACQSITASNKFNVEDVLERERPPKPHAA